MTPLTGPLTDWPTDSTNYKEMLSHLKIFTNVFAEPVEINRNRQVDLKVMLC